MREVRRRTLVVIASDKGLCGAFNMNVFRHAESELKGIDRSTIDLIPVGRRANDYFGKRGWKGSLKLPELGDQVDLAKAQELARHLIALFAAGGTDEVDLLYTKFISTGSRRIVQEKLLPIASARAGTESRRTTSSSRRPRRSSGTFCRATSGRAS